MRRFDSVPITVEARESESTYDAILQPWTCNAGATYVAWKIGHETGRLGVYDPTRERVWLGPTGYPVEDGRYRYFISLGDTGGELGEQVRRGHTRFQSPSATARTDSLDVWKAGGDHITPCRPAPSDAAEVGALHPFRLSWWRSTSEGLFQPWRPLAGGAVYVAFLFDDALAEFGVYDSHSVWFGRTSPLSGCYFAHPGADETFDELATDIESLYDSVPDAGFRAV